LIVVLGHQSCGAVAAAIQGGDNGHNLNVLLSHVAPALAKSGEGADVNEVVKTNAQLNAEELVTRSQIIANAVENDGVEIIPAYYSLESGKVDLI
jgi:carbonic anhydrase